MRLSMVTQWTLPQRRQLAVLAIILVVKFANAATPGNTSPGELDDLLQGFDTPLQSKEKSDTTDEELDQLLEGFDEPPADNATSGNSTPVNSAPELLDDVLQGFTDDSVSPDLKTSSSLGTTSPWEYNADVTMDFSYSYAHKSPAIGEPDYRGLSAARFYYEPEFKYRLNRSWTSFVSAGAFYDAAYEIKGRNRYSSQMLEAYEREIELREAYVLGSSPNADVKIGRQIVVWGKSDTIRIVDVLNPLDLREPGIVDIEDLRLPVTMTRLDYYVQQWNITAIAIHEIRFNKVPVYNSEYYPGARPAPPENNPDSTAANTEFALALNGYFSGWDLSIHWAQVFDDQPQIETVSPSSVVQRHQRINMAGAAANLALGNWLLKSEMALLMGLKYSNAPDTEYDRLDSLLGVDYSGLTDAMLSLEIANRHVFDYTPQLIQPADNVREDNIQYALRYNGDFLHERLNIVFLSTVFGERGQEGGFTRISGTYEVLDDLAVTLGVIDYHSGDNPRMQAIADNDRLFLKIRYSY
jgi:hypothetical protein